MKQPKKKIRPWITALLALVLAGVVTWCALLGAVLAGSGGTLRGSPEIMIILGAQVTEEGPVVLLRDRLDTALDYLEEHPDLTVVVSGGQGANEPTTEARAMADYLMEHGVEEDQILLEETSTNTRENLINSYELLEELGYDVNGDVVVVSNAFHLTRVEMIWNRVWPGDGELSTLAAPSSHAGARVAMYLRETLALVKSFFMDR